MRLYYTVTLRYVPFDTWWTWQLAVKTKNSTTILVPTYRRQYEIRMYVYSYLHSHRLWFYYDCPLISSEEDKQKPFPERCCLLRSVFLILFTYTLTNVLSVALVSGPSALFPSPHTPSNQASNCIIIYSIEQKQQHTLLPSTSVRTTITIE